jgi:hypothetical protein
VDMATAAAATAISFLMKSTSYRVPRKPYEGRYERTTPSL